MRARDWWPVRPPVAFTAWAQEQFIRRWLRAKPSERALSEGEYVNADAALVVALQMLRTRVADAIDDIIGIDPVERVSFWRVPSCTFAVEALNPNTMKPLGSMTGAKLAAAGAVLVVTSHRIVRTVLPRDAELTTYRPRTEPLRPLVSRAHEARSA